MEKNKKYVQPVFKIACRGLDIILASSDGGFGDDVIEDDQIEELILS